MFFHKVLQKQTLQNICECPQEAQNIILKGKLQVISNICASLLNKSQRVLPVKCELKMELILNYVLGCEKKNSFIVIFYVSCSFQFDILLHSVVLVSQMVDKMLNVRYPG